MAVSGLSAPSEVWPWSRNVSVPRSNRAGSTQVEARVSWPETGSSTASSAVWFSVQRRTPPRVSPSVKSISRLSA